LVWPAENVGVDVDDVAPLVCPLDDPKLSPTVEVLPCDGHQNRVRRLSVAHRCGAERALDRPADPFRQRQREPVPRRHERLNADQIRLGFERRLGRDPQLRRRDAPEAFREHNVSVRHAGAYCLDDDHARK
jgi:hypothetical protein